MRDDSLAVSLQNRACKRNKLHAIQALFTVSGGHAECSEQHVTCCDYKKHIALYKATLVSHSRPVDSPNRGGVMFKAEFVGLVSNLIRSQQPYFGKSEKKVQLCASSDAAGALLCGRGLQPANQRRPRRSPARGRRRLRARLQGRAAGGRPRACGRARRRRRQIRLLPSGASRRLGRPSAGWVDGGRGLPVRLHGAGWLKLVGSKTFGTVCRVLGGSTFFQ